LEQRIQAKLTVTERVKALGHHQFKAGVDFESNILDSHHLDVYGGSLDALVLTGQLWNDFHYVKLGQGPDHFVTAAPMTGEPIDTQCQFLTNNPLHGNTWNIGGFIQDSWSILPNLTVNAGLRYEQQRLQWAEALRNRVDPALGRSIGTDALEL